MAGRLRPAHGRATSMSALASIEDGGPFVKGAASADESRVSEFQQRCFFRLAAECSRIAAGLAVLEQVCHPQVGRIAEPEIFVAMTAVLVGHCYRPARDGDIEAAQ